MTPEQQREELSRAYVSAVAAVCGYKRGEWSQDDSCVDVTISTAGIVGAGTYADPKVDLQLKCTSDRRHVLRDGRISWSLSLDHHAQLVSKSMNPKLLVVVVLPSDPKQWLSHSPKQLVLRRCAWWLRMTGLPAAVPKKGQNSVTVHLPKKQTFSPEALQSIMATVSAGQMP